MSKLLEKKNNHKINFSENEILDEVVNNHRAQYDRLVNSHNRRVAIIEEQFAVNIKLFEDTHASYVAMLKKISMELEPEV